MNADCHCQFRGVAIEDALKRFFTRDRLPWAAVATRGVVIRNRLIGFPHDVDDVWTRAGGPQVGAARPPRPIPATRRHGAAQLAKTGLSKDSTRSEVFEDEAVVAGTPQAIRAAIADQLLGNVPRRVIKIDVSTSATESLTRDQAHAAGLINEDGTPVLNASQIADALHTLLPHGSDGTPVDITALDIGKGTSLALRIDRSTICRTRSACLKRCQLACVFV